MKQVLLTLLLLLTVASCAGEGSAPTSTIPSTDNTESETTNINGSITGPEWAMPGLRFLDALNAAARDGDTESMLGFYHPNARLVLTDGLGVATGWRQISDTVERLPQAESDLVLIGFGFAATVSHGAPGCVDDDCAGTWVDFYQIWDGAIGLHIRADLTDPESSPSLHSLFVDSAVAYSDHDIEAMGQFYSEAVFAPGFPVEEYETLFESFPDLAAQPMTLTDLGVGVGSDLALFDLGRTGTASPRSRAALGIYEVTFTPTVEIVAATLWRLWDGRIVEAATLFDPPGWDLMLDAADLEPPESWYSSVQLPEPRTIERTHQVDLGDGTTTELFNATDRSFELVEWAIGRFRTAEMAPPHVKAIYLESERSCLEESAWTYLSETTADIRLCLSDDQIADENGLSMTSKITMLHELGHVWAAEHLSEDDREAFLADRGLLTWNDASTPWSERGNEHAAEIIAWGLSKDSFDVVRIGGSSCEDLTGAFRSLTGSDPAHDC